MSRLETIRLYFVERFFELLVNDPEFTGLNQPAELFDSSGAFLPAPDLAGFLQMPTLSAIQARIETSTSEEEAEGLRRYQGIVRRAVAQLFGSLANVDPDSAAAWAARAAPVVRHPDEQTYWPVDVGRFLNVDDGVLRSSYYEPGGARSLGGDLMTVLFENPASWSGPQGAKASFEARLPFVATIGVDSAPAYPAIPLTAGHLNLTAADVRLTPGRLRPTLYAEMKSLQAALSTNQHYTLTAESGGRYRALKGNRLHSDPLLRSTIRRSLLKLALQDPTGANQRIFRLDPVLLVFHAFYPADDGARRSEDGSGTNREFHHLAAGVLLPGVRREGDEPPGSERQGILLVSHSPDTARAIPLDHPSVRFVDEAGNESQEGSHPVIYANTLQVQGLGMTGDNVNQDPLQSSSSDSLDYNPDDWQWWVGLGSAMGLGALAGSPAGPIGALIGAAVGLVIYILAWLLKKIFGGDEDREKEHTEQEPWPGSLRPTSVVSYQQSKNNDIGPGGTTSDSGGAKAGRSYDLKLIPHFPAENLYGLAFSGGDTFQVIDDARQQETLAWLSFEGGLGYQFDRRIPGRAESAGTSLRNYFDLFLRKLLEIGEAQSQVVYFEQ